MPGGLPLIVVDAANVVGSVPDGWWRDRIGAVTRLRDALVPVATQGLPAAAAADPLMQPPLDVVLVVEGAARGVTGVAGVATLSAPGSGDDAIVELVRSSAGRRRCVVVTADRELRRRVAEYGVLVLGPRSVPRVPVG
jgi:hypothetical protein